MGHWEVIKQNQRGNLFPKKKKLEDGEVTHWLEMPPIPGDIQWGDKEYEIIEDLVLQPLNKE